MKIIQDCYLLIIIIFKIKILYFFKKSFLPFLIVFFAKKRKIKEKKGEIIVLLE